MPTCKVQGQIYYRVGSLLPMPDAQYKCLHIYFMGNTDEKIKHQCLYCAGTKRKIFVALQTLFD